jgi:ribonuclease HI
MEMTAAINALKELREPYEIELYSDSKYLIDGMTKWTKGWIKSNWVNSARQPVKNKDLWLELLELSKSRKISWSWVAGHAGHEFNERVDKLAKSRCAKNRSAGRE